jgi:nickel transport protein
LILILTLIDIEEMRHMQRMTLIRGTSAAIALASAALIGSAALQAHDIAVFPTLIDGAVAVAVKYGHPGDYGATSAGKLIELDAFTPSGERRPLAGRVRPDGTSLVAALEKAAGAGEQGTWVFASFYDNGFFVKTAEGRSVNTTKADYPAAETATHNLKFGKALLHMGGASRGFDRVAGHRLELVPRSDPFASGMGGELRVEIQFEGKPLAGATVHLYSDAASSDTTTHVADRAGVVRVPLSRGGMHVLSVSHDVASRHPALATRDVYAATLVFTRAEQTTSAKNVEHP